MSSKTLIIEYYQKKELKTKSFPLKHLYLLHLKYLNDEPFLFISQSDTLTILPNFIFSLTLTPSSNDGTPYKKVEFKTTNDVIEFLNKLSAIANHRSNHRFQEKYFRKIPILAIHNNTLPFIDCALLLSLDRIKIHFYQNLDQILEIDNRIDLKSKDFIYTYESFIDDHLFFDRQELIVDVFLGNIKFLLEALNYDFKELDIRFDSVDRILINNYNNNIFAFNNFYDGRRDEESDQFLSQFQTTILKNKTFLSI